MTNHISRRALLTTGGLAAGALAFGTPAHAGRAPSGAAGSAPPAAPVGGFEAACDRGPWAEVPRILRRICPPTFPRRQFPITRYGAKGDGVTDCTAAFAQAIAACRRAGGGRVVVPAGDWPDRRDPPAQQRRAAPQRRGDDPVLPGPGEYLPVVMTRWEGTECYNYSPFIYAYGQRDVAVTGHGTLDGQARLGPWESWYANSGPQGADQRELRRMGSIGAPVEQRRFGPGTTCAPR